MRQRGIVIIIAGLVGLALALPLGRAAANSAPPPAVNWFYIQYAMDQRPRLLGAELWGCADAACAQPVLLQSWGQCSAAECSPNPDMLSPAYGMYITNFDCGAGRCRSSALQYGRPFFRLALQFDDRLRLQGAALPLAQGYGSHKYWQVMVTPDGLELSEVAGQPYGRLPVPPFLAFFGLTLAVELLAAGVYAMLRWKLGLEALIGRLAIVALVNLISYPVVWGFFPALIHWSASSAWMVGAGLIGFTLPLAGLLWGAFNARTTRSRVVWIVLTVALLVAGVFCLLLLTFSVSYGYPAETPAGLPVWAAVLLAEVYAVLLEGLLLFGFTRRQVRLREALLVSLGMNAASFIVGLLLAI